MPHNLLIVDYGLGHPGSAHDSYAFRSTQVYQEHDTLWSTMSGYGVIVLILSQLGLFSPLKSQEIRH